MNIKKYPYTFPMCICALCVKIIQIKEIWCSGLPKENKQTQFNIRIMSFQIDGESNFPKNPLRYDSPNLKQLSFPLTVHEIGLTIYEVILFSVSLVYRKITSVEYWLLYYSSLGQNFFLPKKIVVFVIHMSYKIH